MSRPADLPTLLARAEADVIAQGLSYGSELDEDHAWRCSWNTWRTLQDLLPAVRALLDQQQPAADTLASVTALHPEPARRTA